MNLDATRRALANTTNSTYAHSNEVDQQTVTLRSRVRDLTILYDWLERFEREKAYCRSMRTMDRINLGWWMRQLHKDWAKHDKECHRRSKCRCMPADTTGRAKRPSIDILYEHGKREQATQEWLQERMYDSYKQAGAPIGTDAGDE